MYVCNNASPERQSDDIGDLSTLKCWTSNLLSFDAATVVSMVTLQLSYEAPELLKSIIM